MNAERNIVDELRAWAGTKVGEQPPALPNQWGPALSNLLTAAANEIERLRSLAAPFHHDNRTFTSIKGELKGTVVSRSTLLAAGIDPDNDPNVKPLGEVES